MLQRTVFCVSIVLSAAALLGQNPPAASAPALPPGDGSKGKALVESNGCLNCHRIGDKGSHMGPDLSDIGGRRSPERLLRAIVAPDEGVLPENRFVRVVTKDGKTTTGRLLNH